MYCYVTVSQRQFRSSLHVGVLSFRVELDRAIAEYPVRVWGLSIQVIEESDCSIAFRPVG